MIKRFLGYARNDKGSNKFCRFKYITPKIIIQISDCHILENDLLHGVNTKKRLEKIINHLPKNIDALVLTGDLTHYGDNASYQKINKILPKIPTLAIAGNHDNKEKIIQSQQLDLNTWQIIGIDSTVKNKVYGFITADEIKKIKKQLDNSKNTFVLIAIHHPPIPMQSAWDDKLSLSNPEVLFNLLKNYPNVKGIIWGHSHEGKDFYKHNLHLLSCPSTAGSFDKKQIFGFRKINLHNNGDITTKIITFDKS